MRAIAYSVLAATLLFIGAAEAQQTWRMSTKQPADSPEGKVFQKFADLTAEYSGNRLKVQVYPSEQLGKQDAVLEQLQLGTIQIFAEDSSTLNKWAPDISYAISPFMFKDREHWVRFMKSDLVKGWFDKVRTEAGITLIGGDATAIYRGPYRVLVTRKPVYTLADFSKLKLRLYPDKLATDAWTWIGADVHVLAWTDTYEGIRTGLVEAVNSPVSVVEGMKFYEVAKEVARQDEIFQGIALMTNAKTYLGLAPDIKAAVDKAHHDAATFSRETLEATTKEAVDRMAAKGVQFVTIDSGPFVERMRQFYADRDKAGTLPKGFMQAVDASR
jgi:TRAP-type C4-dicarboxylate transport system substrate-binding protein